MSNTKLTNCNICKAELTNAWTDGRKLFDTRERMIITTCPKCGCTVAS